jgi:hypothetical protein
MILITGADALMRLIRDCRFPEEKARRLLNIAWEFGQKAEPCPGGYVHIWYHGKDDAGNHVFSVIEHIGDSPRRKVATGEIKDYTQGKTEMPGRSGRATTNRRENKMPRGRTRTAPEPEVAAANGEAEDFGKYLDKPLTATMEDYVTWFEDNVAKLEEVPVDKLLALGSTLYPKFQKSDFNISQREARAAEREPEPEPAKPTRGRSTAKPAASKPAGRSAAKPAARSGRSTTRGRSTAAAGATPEAPF